MLVCEDCSGCSHWKLSSEEQLFHKIDKLQSLAKASSVEIPTPKMVPHHELILRDRIDLVLANDELGLFDRERKKITDMSFCPLLSPQLADWLAAFRKILPRNISKGSLRLRVGVDGKRGVWLDFANRDFKELLNDQGYLKELLTLASVEIGQKFHHLKLTEEEVDLVREPQYNSWFQTFINEDLKPASLTI